MTIPAPLPSTIKGSKVFPKQQEYLVNLISTERGLISRPALTKVASASGRPRGLFTYNDVLYSCFGNTLYSGTDTLSSVGVLPGDQDIQVARGFTQAAIATGSEAYTLSTAGTLSAVTDPDLPGCKGVTRIRGRFVWVPSDGESLLFSEVGDAGDIGAISLFDAESFPDKNVAVENVKGDLIALNEESIEPFRDIGPENFPFVPVDNAVISVGYVGGKILTKDSILFLGKDKDNGYAFYLVADGVPTIVSNDSINEMLNQDYTKEQLQAVRTQRFNWRGVDCYVFSLYDRTLLFQNGKWSYLDQGIIAPTRFSTFDYYHAVLLGTTWYLQAWDGLYKLTANQSDTSGDFARQFTTYARSSTRETVRASYIELDCLQGTSMQEGSIGLSLSRDNKLWTQPLYRNIADIGEYDNIIRWSAIGGLGKYPGGLMALNVYTTDAIEFSADNMLVNV